MYNFKEGDKRTLTATVGSSNSNETIIIKSASFKLTDGDEIIKSGNCEVVAQAKVQYNIHFDRKGKFNLEVKFEVGPDAISVDTEVVVR